MKKAGIFIVGLLLGVVSTILVVGPSGAIDCIHDPLAPKALIAKIEAIPVEDECAIFSTAVLSRDEHAMAWTDGKRYIVAGWIVGGSGQPLFYWTGADVPANSTCANAGPATP